jgi:hypothetical protein
VTGAVMMAVRTRAVWAKVRSSPTRRTRTGCRVRRTNVILINFLPSLWLKRISRMLGRILSNGLGGMDIVRMAHGMVGVGRMVWKGV